MCRDRGELDREDLDEAFVELAQLLADLDRPDLERRGIARRGHHECGGDQEEPQAMQHGRHSLAHSTRSLASVARCYHGSMSRLGAAACGLACAACNLVFPREEEDPGPVTPTVSVRLVAPTVLPTPASDTIVTDERPVTDAGVQVFFDDGSSVTLDPSDEGRFEFARPTQRYRLVLTRGIDKLEIDEDAAELVIDYPRVGRTNATPFQLPTTLDLPTPTTNTQPALAITGQWALVDENVSTTIDLSTVATLDDNSLGLLSSMSGDRAYYLEYANDFPSAGIQSLSKVIESSPFELADGADLPFTGQTTDVAVGDQNSCVHVSSTLPSPITTFEDVLAAEGTWGPTFAFVATRAVPDPAVSNEGFALSTTTIPDGPFVADLAGYNPFAGHRVIAISGTAAFRQYTYPETAQPVNLIGVAQLAQAAELSASCAANSVTLDTPVAIPRTARLSDTPLETEFQPITLPRPGRVELRWETTTGAPGYYDVLLFELVSRIDVMSTVVSDVEFVRRYRTRNTSLQIDTDLLGIGKIYAFAIISRYGATDVATGDYAHVQQPTGLAIRPTSTFIAL